MSITPRDLGWTRVCLCPPIPGIDSFTPSAERETAGVELFAQAQETV